MGGYLLLCGFLICGVTVTDALLRRRCALVRLWTGLACGLMLMMWLPALYAFFMDFTVAAQWCGLAAAALLAGGCAFACRKQPRADAPFCGDMPPWLLLTAVPMVLLAGWEGEDPQALASLILAESVRREKLQDDCGIQVLYRLSGGEKMV